MSNEEKQHLLDTIRETRRRHEDELRPFYVRLGKIMEKSPRTHIKLAQDLLEVECGNDRPVVGQTLPEQNQ
jgi:hypothetical protein